MDDHIGTLFIVSTPIGNMEDMTYRAVRILSEVDALACEDTRQTRKIFERYQLNSPQQIFSYHEHNEEKSGKRILDLLQEGSSVGLCSDAGSPGISDPGYKIIAAAIEAGFPIDVIPGPSAVATALVVSGLSTASYTFKGFVPRKVGARKKFLAMEVEVPHTLVFFESPHRIGGFLESAYEVLGNRKAAICVELTKKFEKTHRGFLKDLSEQFKSKKVKGEITIVIAGNNPKFMKPNE